MAHDGLCGANAPGRRFDIARVHRPREQPRLPVYAQRRRESSEMPAALPGSASLPLEAGIQDLLEHGVEQQQQPKVVIGEGEGRQPNGQYLYNRIPNAALAYGAIYFNPGSFTIGEWSHATDVAYPCERYTLEGYPLREERFFGGTSGHTYGACTLEDRGAL